MALNWHANADHLSAENLRGTTSLRPGQKINHTLRLPAQSRGICWDQGEYYCGTKGKLIFHKRRATRPRLWGSGPPSAALRSLSSPNHPPIHILRSTSCGLQLTHVGYVPATRICSHSGLGAINFQCALYAAPCRVGGPGPDFALSGGKIRLPRSPDALASAAGRANCHTKSGKRNAASPASPRRPSSPSSPSNNS